MRRGTVKFDSKGQFAGHETFPLRLLWLKKAFDAVGEQTESRTFQEQEAIARFGVGRNMAASMRYWALATGFFSELDRVITPTPLGRALLADDGFDPYLEQAATIWLAHWRVASTPEMTSTAYYAFNHLSAIEFDPAMLAEELLALVEDNGWRATRGTLKRDIEVFLRSYVRRGDSLNEDAAEPLLAELAIIREARLGGWYEFVRGPKPGLHDAIFAYALGDYWVRSGGSTTLTAEQICYAAGSPGRVFKLDEDSVITRLMRLSEHHPNRFAEAVDYEKTALKDGSPFTWSQGESLTELIAPERVEQIKADYEKRRERLRRNRRVNPLSANNPETIDDVYGVDEGSSSCVICHK